MQTENNQNTVSNQSQANSSNEVKDSQPNSRPEILNIVIGKPLKEKEKEKENQQNKDSPKENKNEFSVLFHTPEKNESPIQQVVPKTENNNEPSSQEEQVSFHLPAPKTEEPNKTISLNHCITKPQNYIISPHETELKLNVKEDIDDKPYKELSQMGEIQPLQVLEPVVQYEKTIDLEDFTPKATEIVKDLICPLCSGVLYFPVIDNCGHTFCSNCFERFLTFCKNVKSDNRLLCPITQTLLPNKPAQLHVVENILRQKEIKCKNKINGCGWTGVLSELDEHITQKCPKQVIPCPHGGCTTKLFREQMANHKEICVYRDVVCKYCLLTLPFISLDSHHKNLCPKILLNCPQCCGLKIERENMNSHILNDCQQTVISCPFRDMGCEIEVAKKDMDAHLSSYCTKHLLFLKERINYNGSQIKQNKEEIFSLGSSMKPRVERLVNENSEMKEQIQSIKEEQKTFSFLNKKRKHEESSKSSKNDSKDILQNSLSEIREKLSEDLAFPIKRSKLYSSDNDLFDIYNTKEVKVNGDVLTLMRASEKKEHVYVFSKVCIPDNDIQSYSWSVIFQTESNWIGAGLCDVEQVKLNGFAFSPNSRIKNYSSGVFMISTNGYTWNCLNESQNGCLENDLIRHKGTQIDFTYEPLKKELTYTYRDLSKFKTSTLKNVTSIKGKGLNPAIIMLHPNDQIQMTKIKRNDL